MQMFGVQKMCVYIKLLKVSISFRVCVPQTLLRSVSVSKMCLMNKADEGCEINYCTGCAKVPVQLSEVGYRLEWK
jgi:hypothetical protein